jgi:hypothetical protein
MEVNGGRRMVDGVDALPRFHSLASRAARLKTSEL